jgi:hypothetical protein
MTEEYFDPYFEETRNIIKYLKEDSPDLPEEIVDIPKMKSEWEHTLDIQRIRAKQIEAQLIQEAEQVVNERDERIEALTVENEGLNRKIKNDEREIERKEEAI